MVDLKAAGVDPEAARVDPVIDLSNRQGNLLKGIDNRTVKRQGISICLNMFHTTQKYIIMSTLGSNGFQLK